MTDAAEDKRLGLLATCLWAALRPSVFFARPAAERSKLHPFVFAMVISVVPAGLFALLSQLISPSRPDIVASAAAQSMRAVVIAPVMIVVQAAAIHLALIIVGGRKSRFRETLYCLCHATAAALPVWIPGIEPWLAMAWWVIVACIGIRLTHQTTYTRAIAAMVGALSLIIVPPLFTRMFLLEAFKIPARSMLPTLMVGDHIFVSKSAYVSDGPRRGDVIVFRFPEHREQDFIKRIVALPGDRLEVVGGRPIINGWPVPQCLVGPYEYSEGDGPWSKHEGNLYVEYLGQTAYLAFYDRVMTEEDSTGACHASTDCKVGFRCLGGFCGAYQGPYKASPAEVWVMGDNRNNSHDSRGWYEGRGGGVPLGDVRGRAWLVWMSFGPGGRLVRDRLGLEIMGLPVAPRTLSESLRSCLSQRPPVSSTTPPNP